LSNSALRAVEMLTRARYQK